MAELLVRLHQQEGVDGLGRLQSHVWAEVPAEISVSYMTGGLKRVRRMIEAYFGLRFSPAARKWVRPLWSRGEPLFRLRYLRKPLIKLGRLRQMGTVDVYRGHMEVLGGDMVAPAARLSREPWPQDLPWVAPSAGEFDIEAESNRPSYLGIFEMRISRHSPGCHLHVFLRDFPQATRGFAARLWQRDWQPLKAAVNLEYLEAEVQSTATREGHRCRFERIRRDGIPASLPPLRTATILQQTS